MLMNREFDIIYIRFSKKMESLFPVSTDSDIWRFVYNISCKDISSM
jgi:hypothetical protein